MILIGVEQVKNPNKWYSLSLNAKYKYLYNELYIFPIQLDDQNILRYFLTWCHLIALQICCFFKSINNEILVSLW